MKVILNTARQGVSLVGFLIVVHVTHRHHHPHLPPTAGPAVVGTSVYRALVATVHTRRATQTAILRHLLRHLHHLGTVVLAHSVSTWLGGHTPAQIVVEPVIHLWHVTHVQGLLVFLTPQVHTPTAIV